MDAITALAAKAKGLDPTDRGGGHGRVYGLADIKSFGDSRLPRDYGSRPAPLRAGLTRATSTISVSFTPMR